MITTSGLSSISCSKYLPFTDHLQHNRQYKGLARRNDLPPHIYWVANKTYSRMRQTRSPQTILMSGESGAGKTESTKLVIEHLAYICGNITEASSPNSKLIKVSS